MLGKKKSKSKLWKIIIIVLAVVLIVLMIVSFSPIQHVTEVVLS